MPLFVCLLESSRQKALLFVNKNFAQIRLARFVFADLVDCRVRRKGATEHSARARACASAIIKSIALSTSSALRTQPARKSCLYNANVAMFLKRARRRTTKRRCHAVAKRVTVSGCLPPSSMAATRRPSGCRSSSDDNDGGGGG